MEPRAVQSARKEEFERVPAPAWLVDGSHTAHVCSGPGAAFTFCGAHASPTWEAFPLSRFCSDWTICQGCAEWVADLDRLAS